MEAIILAGGLGTRLRSTVPDLPKPLAPVGAKPFLGHLLDYWQGQGVKRFILSVGYKHELIRECFGSRYQNAEVDYAVETEPLGTGGGLLLSVKQLRSKEPFLVLNGDTFFAVNLVDLLNCHAQSEADMTLSLVEVPENKRYSGVLLDKDGMVRSMEARSESSKISLVNGGVYMMENNLLSIFEKNVSKKISLEDELLSRLFKQKKRIAGFLGSGAFIDIGVPQDYNRAAEVLSSYGGIL